MTPTVHMTLHRTLAKLALTALALQFSTACLILDGAGEETRPGYTECGDFLSDGEVMCVPGTYCEDPTFSECVAGCLSNDNCNDEQRCIKSDGDNFGTCQHPKNRPDAQSGATPCGSFGGEETTCAPGSYCEDARFSRCEPGCLSSANCGSDAFCDVPGDDPVGICREM